jgi:formamidopyrimidine-DNA glycosylase
MIPVPELPEISSLAKQMDSTLKGERIADVTVRQEKCLNVPLKQFRSLVVGKTVVGVTSRGKWVFMELQPDAHFLLSLGMGGDALYHEPGTALPEKYQVKLGFGDGSALSITFWWFGYAHAVKTAHLKSHKMTASLGPSPLNGSEFTYQAFGQMLAGKKGAIKPVLMNQTCIAGIGNVYIQDILFRAKLHPNRRISETSEAELKLLFRVIKENLKRAAKLGGLAYEKDLFGRHGRFKDFLVGYKEGQLCPECSTIIEKIRTGSTATFICPSCQT